MPKNRFKDQRHVRFVSRLACLIGQEIGSKHCDGRTEAHHLLKPYKGVRGLSMKSEDMNCIPLCQKHHAELHMKFGSEKNLFEFYGLDEKIGQTYAKNLFEKNISFSDENDNCPF